MLACSNEPQPPQNTEVEAEITDSPAQDTLFKIPLDADDIFCFIDQKGDTVIPFGKYALSFSDTITTYGVVISTSGEKDVPVAINPKGETLFEVYWFDNGPDYLEDGLFRIIKNGKIGFADATGKIVIEPQFACAHPFSAGKAKVALDCKLEQDGEYHVMKSDSWFFIDKSGQKIARP